MLVPSAVALPTISDIAEYIENNGDTVVLNYRYYDNSFAIGSFSEHSLRTFDADGARGAAAWLLFVSSIAILSQFAVYISCCYSVFENHYVRFSIIVSLYIHRTYVAT